MNARSARNRCVGIILGLALASFAIVGSAVPASAFNLIGCKWPSGGITFKDNFTGAYDTQGTDASNNWTNATVVTLIEVSSNPDYSQINGTYGNTGWDRLTTGSCGGGIWVKGVLVRLNQTYADAYGPNKKQSVIAHELGHVVGLDHRSTASCSGRSLMFPDTPGRFDSCSIYTVQPDDAAGAAAIY